MSPPIGQILAHYRITAAIGAGGMGEVFRATDTKLGRDVALKVLPAEMAASPERLERFRREAKALAALDHPGIVTVHSVEEADGVHFLTMQLVEGQPLDRLIPDGGLPVERILEIATGLADALVAAHEKGIVHRDLKPANVMVGKDGRVKVLDFGLARMSGAIAGVSGGSELPTDMHTREGVVLGTVPYMSPEQVSGRRVDHRTDVFSLGVMLYEMATGQRPFTGASAVELLSSILKDEPPPLGEAKPGLPAHLGQIVHRCLEKAPENRLQTASDLGSELRALRQEVDSGRAASPATGSRADSGLGRAGAPWIVVLPFKTQGADPELAAFADGLGEDITAGLSRFSHLFVISRHSVLPYTEKALDVRTVGRELGARYALEGAVRRAGSAVRASVQLLDAATGTHMWAEAYDRDLAGAGIFEVQDDITDRVVATVADPYGVLVRSMATAVRDRPAEELSARELALRCSAYWHHIRPDEHVRLRAALERKLEGEPKHAEAWACLSRLVSQEHEFRLNPRPDSVERSREAARRAVEIDPTCQLGWEALAEASYFAHDLGEFRHAAERAMALNPRNTSTLAFMGVLISHGGEWDRGVGIVRRAMELNPHHPGWYHFPQFFDHYRKREFEQALATTKRMNMPEDFWTHAVTAAACGRLGRKEEARAALDALLGLLPGYREELGPTLGQWILDAAVVEQVMEGLAMAEALVAERPHAAPAASTDSGATRIQALAVLPFADMSQAKDQEYLCDGLAEELLNALSKIDALKVAARTSAFSFRGKAVDAGTIARTLGVTSLLDGSIRRSGNRLRISVQLVDAVDGCQLWSERYDREVRDIFELQDEITLAVVAALKLKLFGEERAAVLKRYTDDAEAYELFLRGRHHANTYTAQGWQRAIELFEKAIALQPDYALALAGIAAARGCQWFFGLRPAEQVIPQCRAENARALAIDDGLADAYLSLGIITFFYDWDWRGAERAFIRSIELKPSNGEALAYYALFLAFEGRVDEAMTAGRKALVLDPFAPLINMHVGWAYFTAGQTTEAWQQAAKMIEIDPDFYGAYWLQGAIHLSAGEYPAAADRLRTAVSLGGHQVVVADLASACSLAGAIGEATAILERSLDVRRTEYLPAICLVRIYSRIGDTAAAIEWLEAAFAERNGEMVFLDQEVAGAAADDPLRRLAGEPRVRALLDSMRLPRPG